jgi:hypothetical protein
VTFSDKRVADVVNRDFVAAWVNRGPGFRNMDFWSETRIFNQDLEAYPTKNICTFFLTPDGRVFHYVAGSYSPETFLKILETVSALKGALFEAGMKPKAGGLVEAAKIHAQRAEACAEMKEKMQAAAATPDGWREALGNVRAVGYRGLKHHHGPQCARSLSAGYEYFAALHREWSARTELPELESIRYAYLYGNEFSEETSDSKPIASPPPPPPPAKPEPQRPKAQRADAQAKDLTGTGLPGFWFLKP